MKGRVTLIVLPDGAPIDRGLYPALCALGTGAAANGNVQILADSAQLAGVLLTASRATACA